MDRLNRRNKSKPGTLSRSDTSNGTKDKRGRSGLNNNKSIVVNGIPVEILKEERDRL